MSHGPQKFSESNVIYLCNTEFLQHFQGIQTKNQVSAHFIMTSTGCHWS